ncbi:WG repeat-containing protein [Kaistella jeonii]|nr:WG repeat-containing protein [Kaistella jeonii]SFB90602.1 WG containing repeat-containing protein [Kaistella jeonii]VEI95787.1 Uncharacterised protein [Kaistella jeonii]
MENIFVYSSENFYGLIAYNFKTIIPPTYEEILPAFTHHFWGCKNEKWKLHNFENIEINNKQFEEVETFQNGYACVSKNGKTFGFVDRNGNFKIPAHYLKGQHLGNCLFAVGKDIQGKLKYGIIDLKEELILPYLFDEIPTFTDVALLLLKRRKPLREWLRL